jgi:predicted GH43/DUF377 family glycosyl hydrolase
MSDLNKEYSYKDFTAKDLTKTDPKTWNDTEVIGSCFHQHTPKTVVFPTGITGVTFTRCNLDNVVVPKECTINGGCHRWIAVQSDGENWILDESLTPVEPINKATYIKLGLSTAPLSISSAKLSESVIVSKRKELEDQLAADHAALDAAVSWR